MTGHTPWSDLRQEIDRDPERRRVAVARKQAEAEQAAYEQSLAELRRARAYTQAQLAQELDVPQSQISRIEHQAELYVSTLARYLEAMGGHLELVGVFGNQRVRLALGDLTHPEDTQDTSDTGQTSGAEPAQTSKAQA